MNFGRTCEEPPCGASDQHINTLCPPMVWSSPSRLMIAPGASDGTLPR